MRGFHSEWFLVVWLCGRERQVEGSHFQLEDMVYKRYLQIPFYVCVTALKKGTPE